MEWEATPSPRWGPQGQGPSKKIARDQAKITGLFVLKIETSTPDVRTGVDPHMPIAFTANSLQGWSSPIVRRPVSPRSATVGKFVAPG